MTDTVVETTAPKSVGPGKVKSIALNIIPPALFGALVLGLVFYFVCNAVRKQKVLLRPLTRC